MRIAVVGAGIAGLTAAWLLDETHDVTVYEAADRIGGHADSIPTTIGGRTVHVDLGAQHLAPNDFTAHNALRRELGLAPEDTVQVALHATIMSTSAPQHLLVTPHSPLDSTGARAAVTGEAWQALGAFLNEAVAFEHGDGDWEIDLAEFSSALGIDPFWLNTLIHPWLASFVGCGNDQAPGMSARAAIAWVTRTPPSRQNTAPVFHNIAAGMRTIADRLAVSLGNPPLLQHQVRRLEIAPDGAQVTVHSDNREPRTYDRVVLAAPAAHDIAKASTGLDQLASTLSEFDYVPATITIHEDPAYMSRERTQWSTNNITIHDNWAETSTWYGPILGVDLFKSWTTHREPPRKVIAEGTYRHLRVTPSAVRARRRLRELEQAIPIRFAGSYLADVDSQETAVRSASDAVHSLTDTTSRSTRLTSTAGEHSAPHPHQ